MYKALASLPLGFCFFLVIIVSIFHIVDFNYYDEVCFIPNTVISVNIYYERRGTCDFFQAQ